MSSRNRVPAGRALFFSSATLLQGLPFLGFNALLPTVNVDKVKALIPPGTSIASEKKVTDLLIFLANETFPAEQVQQIVDAISKKKIQNLPLKRQRWQSLKKNNQKKSLKFLCQAGCTWTPLPP